MSSRGNQQQHGGSDPGEVPGEVPEEFWSLPTRYLGDGKFQQLRDDVGSIRLRSRPNPAATSGRGRPASRNDTKTQSSSATSRTRASGNSGKGSFGGVSKSPVYTKFVYTNRQDLANVDQTAMDNNGSKAVSTSEGNIKPMPKKKAAPFSERSHGSKASLEKPKVRCVQCHSTEHFLKDCLFASCGYIIGCTLCNTLAHSVDDCQRFIDMSLKDKVRVLVHERAWRPVLKTAKPWWEYLREYALTEDATIPLGFPWSCNFTIAKYDEDEGLYLPRLQRRWDQDHNEIHLVTDPMHKNGKAVALLYWYGQIWPAQP
ncbi:hypothetical protein FLONG3_4594 [Fusarium longipes]|uniref:Uncharacterized protein n=1 Tax=Fusarium longipes TaxID=694270 RepID=A0A395SYM0_9HYPO|nr:hypothetical protein FLONG3_4594 [Fusarium longipes]